MLQVLHCILLRPDIILALSVVAILIGSCFCLHVCHDHMIILNHFSSCLVPYQYAMLSMLAQFSTIHVSIKMLILRMEWNNNPSNLPNQ